MRVRDLMTLEGWQLVGILTETDLVRVFADRGVATESATVGR